jgi:hypothetical protein
MIALRWMLRESKNAGLLVDSTKETAVLNGIPADPGAKMHNSLTPAWWIAELVPKPHWDMTKDPPKKGHRMNFWRARTILDGATIHPMVIERMQMPDKHYNPNLPGKYLIES